jgi:alpha-2-macroglobulin
MEAGPMPGGSRLRGRAFDRATAAKAAAAIGVFVILAAILGPTALKGPTATPGHSTPASSQVAALPTTSPTEAPEAWSELALGPYVATAELVADDQDRIGIGTTTSFTLRSRTSTPAVELARGLQVDPPVKLAITAGATADTASVRPLSPLAVGQRYRIRLESADGSLAGTWAFRTRAPLHVVGTLPGDHAVEVPTNTGIEITFDQDGVIGVADHLAITPKVSGRFEEHGRTWAFVPTKALATGTIYTVTIHKGIGLTGSTETLGADLTFRFETAATSGPTPRIEFGRAMIEIPPDQKPTVPVSDDPSDDAENPVATSVGIVIHRLPDFKSVIAAGIALAGPDSWAVAAPSAIVSTAGLTRVAKVDAPIVSSDAGPLMTIPVRLAKGAYIVTIQQPGAPAQLLIQVTSLSAYAMVGTQTSLAWVNDLGSDGSVAGATVSLTGGRLLGSTGSDGILRVATPRELAAPTDPVGGTEDAAPRASQFLTVTVADLGSLLVPLGLPIPFGYANATSWWYGPGSDAWWLLFGTDRTTYRQTDTVHVYGTIRARADRSVPDGIELRLRTPDSSPDAPILRVPVHATARGVFTADLRIADLPRAQYEIDLFVGKALVSSVWVYVGGIVKPAYQVDVHTDRHSYLAGQKVTISTTTAFYDGTPVPGMELQFNAGDQHATAVTDALGHATATLKAATEDGPEGVGTMELDVAPVHPEEGQIGATLYISVIPSRSLITGQGTVTGGNIVVTGTLSSFDLAAYEAALAAGGSLEDPSGAPIAGGTVQARVTHVVEKREQTGTTYDFIEKKIVPLYETSETEVVLGTHTLTSALDGTFRLSLPAPVATDIYRIRLTSLDPQGRKVELGVEATARADSPSPSAYLEVPGGCGVPSLPGRLDNPVKLTMRQGDGSTAVGGRFLFVVGELGSLEATVQDSPTFARTLRDADLPGFTARGVWLTKNGYQAADVVVEVDQRDKAVTIHLQPDRASYQPGDQVTIGVTTTGPTGRPVLADVVIQGVDQKLYTLGMASDVNPLDELLAQVAPGFLTSYESHAVPVADGGGCGGTGGGDRGDFRDTVTFKRITTNASGQGSIAFKLSDDLTSWHMSALAVTGALDAGQASVLIPVGLPFFVDASLAPEYLVGDQPILRLRGYGAGLATGDHVRFVVSAPSLGLAPTVVEGTAFEALRLTLPTMTAGDHAIRIEATGTHAGKALSDVLLRTVHVVDSRLGTVAASYDPLGPDFNPQGGDGLTTYIVTDAGRGRLIAPLRELVASTSARFDRTAAAELARRLLIDEFDVPPTSLPTSGFDPDRFQTGAGVALLPYGSADLFLAARAALVAGSIMDIDALQGAFRAELEDAGSTNRERQIVALAGLAGTGADVMEQLRSYDVTTLTLREQLWLALGFAAAGDEASARTIERIVLEASGQRLGPWVRLAAGTSLDDSLEASGLLLLLAARLGDPIASDVSRYLTDHPSNEHVFPLEQLGYVQGMLDRLPRTAGRFAWTVDGQRHDVTLEPGGALSLVLTPAQRASLRLEPLAGQLAVTTTWTATGGDVPSDPSMSVARTVTPAGDAPDDHLVKVTLTVSFGAQAPGGCYRLTDLLPSGLAPVVAGAGWIDEEAEGRPDVIGPYEIEGQRVSWCVSPQDLTHVYGYSARVVTPGAYRWEPAVVQSETAPTIGSSTAATTYSIR